MTDKTAQHGSKLRSIIKGVLILLLAFALGYLVRWITAGPSASDESEHVGAPQVAQKQQIWTCSMHPQIRLPKPGLCPICNMDLIPVSADETETATSLRQLTVSENAKELMDIVTVPVERKLVTATVRMVGKVDYDETKLAYITAWIPGRLDRLYVDYTGVPVKKGDHLVYLYSPELISAQEELIQAIEAVKSIEETELGVMREMARSTVKAAREKLRLWGLNTDQVAEIEKTGKVSDHMTIYAPTSGIVIHKNAIEGMYVETGTRIFTIADLSQVWVKLDAYESDLEWLRYGQEVEFTTVSYTGQIFKGTISFIDPILNERTRTVKVRVNVPNPDGRLKPSMFVKAVVRARVAGGGRIMDADLAGKWICPMHPEIIKPGSGICDICQMPLVRTESLGYVSDDPALIEKPLVIPVSAALVTGTRAIVYVQLPNTDKPTFEGREIVLGPRAGDYYLVRSGLEEGELVVTKGNFKIDSSLQIMAKPSMMTPEGGAGGAVHDHGPAAEAEQSDTQPTVESPAMFRYQLKLVLAAADKVKKSVADSDIARAQSAFAYLGKAIKDVDARELEGHAQMLWKELSMKLTNDAVEGAEAKTLKEAKAIAQAMTKNINSLKTSFGITHDHAMESTRSVSDSFRIQLVKVYDSYFKMQQALAADSHASAADAAKEALNGLKAVDMKLLSGRDHDRWMKTSGQLEAILKKAAATDNIKSLRESFFLLSQHLTKLAKRFGSVGLKPLYIVHCPMAFDNTGANWLQPDDQVLNPYFGKMMLKCGGVKEIVGPANIWKKEPR